MYYFIPRKTLKKIHFSEVFIGQKVSQIWVNYALIPVSQGREGLHLPNASEF